MYKRQGFLVIAAGICFCATSSRFKFLFPMANSPVSYTHLDVYKRQMQSRILTTAYVGIFLLRDVLSADELERWKCFVYEKENLFSEFSILCALQGLLENVFSKADLSLIHIYAEFAFQRSCEWY